MSSQIFMACGKVNVLRQTRYKLSDCGDVDRKRYTFAQDVGDTGAKSFTELRAVHADDGREGRELSWGVGSWLEDVASSVMRNDGRRYEVLRSQRPSRLFLDVEWDEDEEDKDLSHDEKEEKGRKKVATLFRYLEEYCFQWDALAKRLVFSSHRRGKFSFHVIYPDIVFRDITDDMKKFVLGFVYFLYDKRLDGHDCDLNSLWFIKETPGSDDERRKRGQWNRCIVDTFVYTPNRCFRMPYQSKASDATRTTFTLDERLTTAGEDRSSTPRSSWLVQGMGRRLDAEAGKATISRILDNRRVEGIPRFPCAYRIPERKKDAERKDEDKDDRREKLTKRPCVVPLFIGEKCAPRIVIETNEDILNHLDPAELKAADYGGVFLPILAELVACFPKETVKCWLGGEDREKTRKKNEKNLKYAESFVHRKAEGGAILRCSAALAFLKKVHRQVKDMRPESEAFQRLPKVDIIEATPTNGWEFVSKSDGFREVLQKQFPRRNRYKNKSKSVQSHSALLITGKMGVGKTEELLRFVKTRLKEGSIRSALYLAPRTLLVDQAVTRFRNIPVPRCVNRRCPIVIKSYHSGLTDGVKVENEVGKTGADPMACNSSSNKGKHLMDTEHEENSDPCIG